MNKKILSDKYISIGKITKPHGLAGVLKFILFNEESNILLDQEFLNINKNSKSIKLKIENIDVSSLLIKFFDINNRESAEQYRECEIVILLSKIKGNKDDLYFVDLIGCDLYFDDNKIGSVLDVVSYSGNDLLKIIDFSIVHSRFL